MQLIGNILSESGRAAIAFPNIKIRSGYSKVFCSEEMNDIITVADRAGSMMYDRLHELKMNAKKGKNMVRTNL